MADAFPYITDIIKHIVEGVVICICVYFTLKRLS